MYSTQQNFQFYFYNESREIDQCFKGKYCKVFLYFYDKTLRKNMIILPEGKISVQYAYDKTIYAF